MQHSIFISYRRDDSEGEAGRLYDDLVRAYGKDAVFMDVSGIAPGLDFRKAIDDNVAGCGVFLAIIGPEWASLAGAAGKRRLDDLNDFVRLEVASALARKVAVIPVLVHEARMPHPDQLSDNIKDLAYRNSVEISHTRWDSDVNLLIGALRQYATTTPVTENQPIHADVPVQLPPPVSTDSRPSTPAPASRTPLILGVSAAVLVLAVAGYLFASRQASPTKTIPPTPQQQQAPASDQANLLPGVWRNTDTRKGEDALASLRIDGSGRTYNVEAIGQCQKGPCSWGTQTVVLNDGGQATGTWTPTNTPQEVNQRRTVTLTIQPSGGRLDVAIRNTWWQDPNSKPRVERLQSIFERQP